MKENELAREGGGMTATHYVRSLQDKKHDRVCTIITTKTFMWDVLCINIEYSMNLLCIHPYGMFLKPPFSRSFWVKLSRVTVGHQLLRPGFHCKFEIKIAKSPWARRLSHNNINFEIFSTPLLAPLIRRLTRNISFMVQHSASKQSDRRGKLSSNSGRNRIARYKHK